MGKHTMEKRCIELRQVMVEEGSRGRPQPVTAVSLERQRRIRQAAKMLADRNCDKRTYMAVIREDFELQDGSDEFLQFLKVWDDCR